MPYDRDPYEDDYICCDVCGEPKQRMSYQFTVRGVRHSSMVLICERCDEPEPEECSVCHGAGGWTDALSGDWNICGHCQEAVR